jgi:hypothetical protein
MTGQDSWDNATRQGNSGRTVMTEQLGIQPGQDSSDRTARTGQVNRREKRGWPEHDCKDRKTGTGPPGQEAGAGQPRQNSQDRKARTGQPGRIIGTGLLGQASLEVDLKNQSGEVSLDRTEMTEGPENECKE